MCLCIDGLLLDGMGLRRMGAALAGGLRPHGRMDAWGRGGFAAGLGYRPHGAWAYGEVSI